MDMSMVTIQYCIDMMLYKNKAVILNDGAVMGFHEEGEIQEMSVKGLKWLKEQEKMWEEDNKYHQKRIEENKERLEIIRELINQTEGQS